MSAKMLTSLGMAMFLITGAALARTPAPKDARAYIISPADGDVVTNPVTIKFGLQGMGVAPAGVDRANTGHHHLLIDVERRPPLDKAIPSNATHKHFGGGQTETSIELAPGSHTLQLILGDKDHIPHQPPVISETISITVK